MSATREAPGEQQRGPLAGVRVLELGHYVAAPFAARLLADYGAEVIKVEQPEHGDPLRSLGKSVAGQSLMWSTLARNKQVVTVDLSAEEGRDLVVSLASECDVLIENFRAGQLERWNIGPERLRERNPQLVIARISGFGQTGPYADRVSVASVGESMGGLLSLMGDPQRPESPPLRANLSLGDTITSLFAVIGVLCALFRGTRAGAGRGETVDVAMYEAVFGMLESVLPEFSALGARRGPGGSFSPQFAPNGFYRARDGKWVSLSATGERLFGRLVQAMGEPELAKDDRFCSNTARVRNRGELDSIIGNWVCTRDAAAAEQELQEAGIPAGRVLSVEDCISDPHYVARGAVVQVNDPVAGTLLQPAIFPRFEISQPVAIRIPGVPGSDNADVLRRLLGMNEQDIAGLAARKVI